MASRTPQDSSRQTRIAEMRRVDRAHDRRKKIIAITASTGIVAVLIGFGAWTLIDQKRDKDAKEAARKAPVKGEQTWDATTLGRTHVDTAVTYEMNPPVGGDHDLRWMNCNGDVYKSPIPQMYAVHSLEHGAVWVTYNEKAAKADLDKLAATVGKTPFTLMSPIKEQAGAIMLSAWGKQLTVDSASDARVAQFFTKYVHGPQTPEPLAPCTNGVSEK